MYFRSEIRDGIAEIIYHQPPVNAFNGEAYKEMAAVFHETGTKKGVRCIIFRTEGKGFIGGNDVNEIAGHTRENHSGYQDLVGGAVMAVYNCPVPVIARVQGYAIGAGMVAALACDLVVASRNAWFSLPEVSLDIVAGSSFVMMDIPRKLLYHMCLTGERVYAQQLCEQGAVNRVTDPEELDRVTMQIAEKVAAMPPKAVKLFKECTKRIYGYHPDEFFRLETVYTDELLGTREREECMKAFFEKRKPVYEDD